MKLTLGDKITFARKYAGFGQKELAAILDVDISQLSRYENNKNEPGLRALEVIASACKLHPSYFFANVLPHDFWQFSEDIKYSYYISCLPNEVKIYFRKAIKKMYKFAVVSHAEMAHGIPQNGFDDLSRQLGHDDYLKYLETLKHRMPAKNEAKAN